MGLLGTAPPAMVWIIAALALSAAAVQTARLWWRRASVGWRLRDQSRRATEGEARAESVLAVMGYEVRARQATCAWTVTLDGTPTEVELRADLIVARDGRVFVAEVKTGALAPRIESAATRRQLLEYRCAFDVDGVLLVDAETDRVREVLFALDRFTERPVRARTSPVVWLAAGVVLGALALYLAFAFKLSAMCLAIGSS